MCVWASATQILITDEILCHMSALHLQMRRWPCIMSITVSLRQDVKLNSTVYGSRSAENDCLCCTLPPCKCFFYRWSSHCQFIWHGFASPLRPTKWRHASRWQVGREKVSCCESRQPCLKYWAETTVLDTKFVLLYLVDWEWAHLPYLTLYPKCPGINHIFGLRSFILAVFVSPKLNK